MLKGLNHITLAISDIDESLKFYINFLGFKGHVKWNSGAYLTLNDLWLCLSLDTPDKNLDYSHIAFSIEQKDFLTMKENILNNNIKEWKSNISEGDSLYILDPDGHKLELHVGNLQTRLNSLKSKPYKNTIWFENV